MATVFNPSSTFRIPGALYQRARAVLAAWRLRLRERAELARLTPSELRDAGITPYDVAREARRSFWRD